MNHTERIAETARRHRHLTRRLAKEAIETYLELLVEEIADGEWVDIHGIARIRVQIEECNVRLTNRTCNEKAFLHHKIKRRLRTQIRLIASFKQYLYGRNSES